MIRILTYFQPERTYLPSTGVGRHINGVLGELSKTEKFDISVLVSKSNLTNEELSDRSPLSHLKVKKFQGASLKKERLWKLWDKPKMDDQIGEADIFYSPVDGYVSFKKNIPRIVTMHDMHLLERDLPWSNTWSQRTGRMKARLWMKSVLNDKVDHILTISNFTKKRMIELLDTPQEKITVVGNGINQSIYDYLDCAASEGVAWPYCVVVGGLRKKKGAERIVEIAKLLECESSQVKIHVIGESEKAYHSAFDELDSLIDFGRLSDESMYQQIRHAVCMLFLSDYEGFGLPVIEAHALKCPVITLDKDPFREFNPEEYFRVASESNALEVVGKIKDLLSENELIGKLVEENYTFSKHFSWQNVSIEVMQVLEKYD